MTLMKTILMIAAFVHSAAAVAGWFGPSDFEECKAKVYKDISPKDPSARSHAIVICGQEFRSMKSSSGDYWIRYLYASDESRVLERQWAAGDHVTLEERRKYVFDFSSSKKPSDQDVKKGYIAAAEYFKARHSNFTDLNIRVIPPNE